MDISIAPGVFDILPNDPKEIWKSSYLWNHVENLIREITKEYGFLEIRTPIFERTELFQRGVGETSDIVSKEMYTFIDKGNRSMSLRPEGTAAVMRSFIENKLQNTSTIHKLYYICPMFRYERAQAGRYRQHHQFGAEVVGVAAPEQEAELIDMLYTLYSRLGLKNLSVNINSIGDIESRKVYRKALQDYLRKHFEQLSEDSKVRFEANPMRILDSKDPKDKEITANAPSILDFLSTESQDHFEALKKLLNILKIPFVVNPSLVRGLDYYNRTVFEIMSSDLGAHNTIGAGGRYDGLLKTLGGPDLPAIGFGSGLERVIQTMLKQQVNLPSQPQTALFLIPLGDEAKTECFKIMHNLRQEGIPVQMDFSGKKLNKAMQYANQIAAQFVAVVGDNELKTEEVELKEMSTGKVTKAPLYRLSRILQIEEKSNEYIKMWNEMTKPFSEPSEAEFFIHKISDSIEMTKKLSNDLQTAMENVKKLIK